eukprot:6175358-Pleurochrysis_carterae.AAC.3
MSLVVHSSPFPALLYHKYSLRLLCYRLVVNVFDLHLPPFGCAIPARSSTNKFPTFPGLRDVQHQFLAHN